MLSLPVLCTGAHHLIIEDTFFKDLNGFSILRRFLEHL